MTVAQILALAAALAVNLGTVPQVLKVWRPGALDGVSPATTLLTVTTCAFWTLYSALSHLALSTWSSAAGTVLWAAVAVGLFRSPSRPPWRPAAAAPALFALACVAATALAGPSGLGTVLVAGVVVVTTPQVVRVYRHGAAGVARSTWTVGGLSAACWFAYGAASGDLTLVVSQAVRVVACTTVVALATVRLRTTDHRADHGPQHDDPSAAVSAAVSPTSAPLAG